MKRKSLFRNVIVSGVTLILISAIIYSCKKSTRIMNPNSDSNTFFTAVKATTPLAFEAGAYEVQLAFKDDKGKGAIPSVFELNMPDGKNFGVKITSKTKGFGDVDIYSGTVMDNLAKGPASRMLNFTLIDDQQHESIFADFGINNVDYILSRKEGNLRDGPKWFASGLSSSGADLLCVVQEPTGAPGSALGWGSKPGWVAVAASGKTTVYRHEVGHNAGSGHCDKGITPYAAGYNNGHWQTHMCGNKVNYYSNPDVQDDQGNPIGDPNTADNARLWRERAAIMSGRVAHVKPFTNCR